MNGAEVGRRCPWSHDRTNGPPREQYVLDSAHHRLPNNRRSAPAGRDVRLRRDRRPGGHTGVDADPKPYWATNRAVRDECCMSMSGDDEVVIDHARAQPVATIPAGVDPQRALTPGNGSFTCVTGLKDAGKASIASRLSLFSRRAR